MGEITVSSKQVDGWVEVRVSDTGTGIPADMVETIFEPFFTTKNAGHGTGQGLALARSVVSVRHGGSIDVESKTGEGATFIIRLPLRVGDSVQATGA
jgi:signal transduction histidine kinase